MNGKIKGSAWEREMCVQLSSWWTHGERRDVFWRTATSGGRATSLNRRAQKDGQSNKKTRVHCGDVCATDAEGIPFTSLITLELKRGYNRLSLQDLLDKEKENPKKDSWAGWIRQAEEARENAGTPYWLILARRDSRKTITLFPSKLLIEAVGPLTLPLSILLRYQKQHIYGCRLDDFLMELSPEDFRYLWKTSQNKIQERA